MQIRRIKKTEWPKVLGFNADQYDSAHVLTNKIYYDWQFDNIFNGNHDSYTSLGLFDRKENLAGTIGLFPAPCNFFGQSVKCNWLANLIVKEDLRSLGYGYLLLKESEVEVDIAVDHNINQLAGPLFTKSGWRGGDIKRYICILDGAKSEVLIGQKDFGLRIFKDYNHTFGSEWSAGLVDNCGPEFDEFWENVKSKYPVSIDRSSAYLNWRYAHNPLVRYFILVARKGNRVVSFTVIRIEPVTQGPERADIGIKVGRIIDFVSIDEAEAYALLEAVKFCRDKGVDFMDLFFTGNFYKDALNMIGFMDCDIAPYSEMPTLLNPIDRTKRTKHNFAVKLPSDSLSKKTEELGLNDFYTTKGCGDQDRPY